MEIGNIRKQPPKPQKVSMAPSSHQVLFADFFQITLAPSHGVIKFGYFHPQTHEFIVHTQVAMTPQGILGLSAGLQKQLEMVQGQAPFNVKVPEENPYPPTMGNGGDDDK